MPRIYQVYAELGFESAGALVDFAMHELCVGRNLTASSSLAEGDVAKIKAKLHPPEEMRDAADFIDRVARNRRRNRRQRLAKAGGK